MFIGCLFFKSPTNLYLTLTCLSNPTYTCSDCTYKLYIHNYLYTFCFNRAGCVYAYRYYYLKNFCRVISTINVNLCTPNKLDRSIIPTMISETGLDSE